MKDVVRVVLIFPLISALLFDFAPYSSGFIYKLGFASQVHIRNWTIS